MYIIYFYNTNTKFMNLIIIHIYVLKLISIQTLPTLTYACTFCYKIQIRNHMTLIDNAANSEVELYFNKVLKNSANLKGIVNATNTRNEQLQQQQQINGTEDSKGQSKQSTESKV